MLLVVACALLGLLVGSFLNVVVWRLPRRESLLRPASHCPTCSAPVRPRDNVPVLSWLVLRGRCRNCAAPISRRYPAVELLTAAVFAALAARLGPDTALPAFLYLGGVGVALALIDLDVHRLPNALTLPSYAVGAALLTGAAAVDGSAGPLLRGLLGMVALLGLYLLLALAYPAGMGLGDVKLAGLLGLYLGWLGWGVWAVGAFAAFLLGGVSGIALMAAGRAGRKSALPFGPFMLGGALLAVLAGQALADAYVGTVG
jgi:leader peptidase (prepilin peptidase)/N-methyltransferase